jgi:ATP adenylyltransferase
MEYFFNFDKIAYIKGKKPEGCILCMIRDSSPDVVDLTVYRSEFFVASVNLYPYNPGHLIIFPKRHLVDIRELNQDEEKDFNAALRKILNALDELYTPSGYNIGYNMGSAAGASINHLHQHIIPRHNRELGMADLIAGKRLLIESPLETMKKLSSIL